MSVLKDMTIEYREPEIKWVEFSTIVHGEGIRWQITSLYPDSMLSIELISSEGHTAEGILTRDESLAFASIVKNMAEKLPY